MIRKRDTRRHMTSCIVRISVELGKMRDRADLKPEHIRTLATIEPPPPQKGLGRSPKNGGTNHFHG